MTFEAEELAQTIRTELLDPGANRTNLALNVRFCAGGLVAIALALSKLGDEAEEIAVALDHIAKAVKESGRTRYNLTG